MLNINYQEVLKLIRLRVANFDQASVCSTFLLGILSPTTLPLYVKFLATDMFSSLLDWKLSQQQNKQDLPKYHTQTIYAIGASDAINTLDHVLLFCYHWAVPRSLWSILALLKYQFPLESWAIFHCWQILILEYLIVTKYLTIVLHKAAMRCVLYYWMRNRIYQRPFRLQAIRCELYLYLYILGYFIFLILHALKSF